MDRCNIDGTPITVSRLSLGTASLHHLFFRSDRRRLLDHAEEAGITHFDTSPLYGHGLAEEALGEFFAKRRERFTVTTKIGLYPKGGSAQTTSHIWLKKVVGKIIPKHNLPTEDWSVEGARRSLEASLRRLRTDHVDFLLVHEPRLDTSVADGLHDWLDRERHRGSVRAFGLAGVENRIGPLVREGHPLAQVIQTLDSLSEREADFVLKAGRPMQFTYGYLSAEQRDPLGVLRAARVRNPSGSLIVSSRRPERIAALASVFV